MKKFAKYFLVLGLIMIILICIPVLVHAQTDPNCDPLDPGCPIDGGVGILLAAGIGYGIKKAKDLRKIKNSL
ncbi:MAG: PID-CTERM protein-sorting domain-containing protein [Sphingobacteriales bacterium]